MNVLALQKGIAQWLEIDSEILTYYLLTVRASERAWTLGYYGLRYPMPNITTCTCIVYVRAAHCICARGAPTILYMQYT